MSKVVITIAQDDDADEGAVNITADFDPPLDNTEGAMHPWAHVAGVVALEAISAELSLNV